MNFINWEVMQWLIKMELVESMWKFPEAVQKFMFFLLSIVFFELILASIQLRKWQQRVEAAEIEIDELNDKLYDKAQEELTKVGFSELELDEEN